MKKQAILLSLIFIIGCSIKNKKNESDITEISRPSIDSIGHRIQLLNAFNTDSIKGHWFQPHAAMINIDFTKEGTFVFNTFDTVLMKDQKLTGTYQIEANKVVLKISNFKLKDEIFQINVNEGGYFLEKEGFYLIKS